MATTADQLQGFRDRSDADAALVKEIYDGLGETGQAGLRARFIAAGLELTADGKLIHAKSDERQTEIALELAQVFASTEGVDGTLDSRGAPLGATYTAIPGVTRFEAVIVDQNTVISMPAGEFGGEFHLVVVQGSTGGTPTFGGGITAASVSNVGPTFGTGAGKATHLTFMNLNPVGAPGDWIMIASREVIV